MIESWVSGEHNVFDGYVYVIFFYCYIDSYNFAVHLDILRELCCIPFQIFWVHIADLFIKKAP